MKDIRLSATRFTGRIKDAFVDGIEELGQRFLMELLTVAGSMSFEPERGTFFLPRLRDNPQTELDIIMAYASVRPQLRRNLKTGDRSAQRSPRERYRDATINQILIDSETVVIQFTIENVAGERLQVQTPPISLKG